MCHVGRKELRKVLVEKWGFKHEEVNTIKDFVEKHGKYDDGKFIVVAEAGGYAFELS